MANSISNALNYFHIVLSVLDVHSIQKIMSSFVEEDTLYINSQISTICNLFPHKELFNLFFLSRSVCLCASLQPKRERIPSETVQLLFLMF